MKLNLGQDSEARFDQDFEAYVLWRGWCLVKILKLMLGRDSEDEIWSRFVFEFVIWTQPSGPLCLWHCFSHGALLTSNVNDQCSDWCLEQRRGDTSEALSAGYNGDENAHVFGPPGHSPSNLHHFPSWFWQPRKFKQQFFSLTMCGFSTNLG